MTKNHHLLCFYQCIGSPHWLTLPVRSYEKIQSVNGEDLKNKQKYDLLDHLVNRCLPILLFSSNLFCIYLLLVFLWIILTLISVDDLLFNQSIMNVNDPICITFQIRIVSYHNHCNSFLRTDCIH